MEVTSWLAPPGDGDLRVGDFVCLFLIGGYLLYTVVLLGGFFEDRKNTPPFVWLWVLLFILWKVCFCSLSLPSLQSTEDAGVSLCWVQAVQAWAGHEAAQRRRWVTHSHREDPLSLCGETSFSQTRPSAWFTWRTVVSDTGVETTVRAKRLLQLGPEQ